VKSLLVCTAAILLHASAASADASGKQLFAANCAMCHQASAEGAVGLAPPLAGSLRTYAYKPDGTPNTTGRTYLSQILISGMSGGITSHGTRYIGVMPSFATQLTDTQIATILAYALHDFNGVTDSIVSPDDVAAARKRNPGPADTYALRKKAVLF
jgi:mono/diheme cytochrome c family protein